MGARLISDDEEKVVVEMTIPKNTNFLLTEQQSQVALSEAELIATGQCLENCDTDGSPLI